MAHLRPPSLLPRIAMLLALSAAAITAVADDRLTLSRFVPNDVALFVATHDNPAGDFLDQYWKDVLQTLQTSGLPEDLATLIAETARPTEEQTAEVKRLKERIMQLWQGVDWEFFQGESVFVERLAPSMHLSREHPNVVMASMVWMAQGTAERAGTNFKGLAEILEAIADEVNRAAKADWLLVERATVVDAEVAKLNLLGAVPAAPDFVLAVARRDDMILIALREDLLQDVLQMMAGVSEKKPLADDARFQAAVTKVPPADDCLVYFDIQALLRPWLDLKQTIYDLMAQPGDHYTNTGINAKASKMNSAALDAYQRGDYRQALELVQKAYAIDKDDSVILYNLACFHALVGDRAEAIEWLEKAVDAGFYAPCRISTDRDLQSLRDAPEYKRALAQATARSRALVAEDVLTYRTASAEAKRLILQIRQAEEEKNYEHALQLNEQALAIDGKDPVLLYSKATLHARLGQQQQAIDSLERAVQSGFFCPQRVSEDPSWDALRQREDYIATLAKAAEHAGEYNWQVMNKKSQLMRTILDRATDTASIFDYSISSASTRGHARWTDSVTVLVPDARNHAIYPLLASQAADKQLDRFLPAETESFVMNSAIQPKKFCRFIEDTLRDGGPAGMDLLQKWEKLQQALGLDLRRDVIELLDGTSISMTLRDGGGSVTLIGVTDEQAARALFERALAGLPKVMAALGKEQPALAGLAALNLRSQPVENKELEGFASLSLAMSPQPIAIWGTTDGFVVLGSSADAIALSLAAARGQHPPFRTNESAAKEALLPDGPFVSAMLANQRGDTAEFASGLRTAAMMGGMFTAGVEDAKARVLVTRIMGMLGKLAPVVEKINFYQSSASHLTFDGEQWYQRAVTRYLSPEERSGATVPAVKAAEVPHDGAR